MRVIPLVVLLCALCQAAVAQTSECSTIPKASDRLACYDRASPATAAAKPATSKTSQGRDKPAASKTDQGQVVDKLAAENSKLDAKLKTICRRC
jgi:hypothetical protein